MRKGTFQAITQIAGLNFSELRKTLRDKMNAQLQEFADYWSTKKGIRVRTKMIKNHLVQESRVGQIFCQTDLKCSLTNKESADINEIFQIGH